LGSAADVGAAFGFVGEGGEAGEGAGVEVGDDAADGPGFGVGTVEAVVLGGFPEGDFADGDGRAGLGEVGMSDAGEAGEDDPELGADLGGEVVEFESAGFLIAASGGGAEDGVERIVEAFEGMQVEGYGREGAEDGFQRADLLLDGGQFGAIAGDGWVMPPEQERGVEALGDGCGERTEGGLGGLTFLAAAFVEDGECFEMRGREGKFVWVPADGRRGEGTSDLDAALGEVGLLPGLKDGFDGGGLGVE
jgi:hypothetical protein